MSSATAPFSFFNAAAAEIPLATLSILRPDKAPKDTARNILATKELVIHFVNEDVLTQMNQTSAPLAAEISEIDTFGIETIASQTVAVPANQSRADSDGSSLTSICTYC